MYGYYLQCCQVALFVVDSFVIVLQGKASHYTLYEHWADPGVLAFTLQVI